MSTRPTHHRVAMANALALTLAAPLAHAAPADYDCEGGTVLNADFTPRAAQVRYGGENWTLTRVRESREARYVSARAGVTVTVVRNQATLLRRGQPALACKLVVRALRQDAPSSQ